MLDRLKSLWQLIRKYFVIREIAPIAPWLPQSVYVRPTPDGVIVYDATTNQPIKPVDGDKWLLFVASKDGDTRVMLRYDNVEIR